MTKKVVTIMAIIFSLFLVIGRYNLESRKLRQTEEVILETENYLKELRGFLHKITQMNTELRDIFYSNLMAKDFKSREFDKKLSEIFFELKKEKARLDEALINLKEHHSSTKLGCYKWWLIKSQKDRYVANQSTIDFYRNGLEVFKCQLSDVIAGIEEYKYKASSSNKVVMVHKVTEASS